MDRRELYTLTGSIIRINDPATGQVHLFSVESAANDKAMIRPCNSVAKQFATSLPEGTELSVTAGTHDGVLHGNIKVERYLVASRMLMVDNPPLEFEQRRESFRVVTAVPVWLGLPRGDELVMLECTTHDLSQGGFAAILPSDDLVPEVGELTTVVVQAPAQAIVAVGEVLGLHPDRRNTLRMRFHQISPLDQTVLASDLRRIEVTKVRTPRGRA